MLKPTQSPIKPKEELVVKKSIIKSVFFTFTHLDLCKQQFKKRQQLENKSTKK